MDVSEKVKAQLVIVTGLVVLYFVFKSPWWLYAAAAVGVLSLAVPVVGDLIVKAWFKLAELLGNINGKIILSVLFFVFLFPIAVLYRHDVQKSAGDQTNRRARRSIPSVTTSTQKKTWKTPGNQYLGSY